MRQFYLSIITILLSSNAVLMEAHAEPNLKYNFPNYVLGVEAETKELVRDRHPELRGDFGSALESVIERLQNNDDQFLKKGNPPSFQVFYNRSLFVNDDDVLSKMVMNHNFTFSSMMNKLAEDSGWGKVRGVDFFVQWWASARLHDPKQPENKGPYGCDYITPVPAGTNYGNPVSGSLINGMPYTCPRLEGTLSYLNTLTVSENDQTELFDIIALINRGDLSEFISDENVITPNTCGEYRIAVRSNKKALEAIKGQAGKEIHPSRAYFLLFEFGLRNKHAVGENHARGATFCLAVQKFWKKLSAKRYTNDDVAELLYRFYFEGIRITAEGEPIPTLQSAEQAIVQPVYDVGPIIDPHNLGLPRKESDGTYSTLGQIRTNMFPGNELGYDPHNRLIHQWLLREYRVRKTKDKTIRIVPAALTHVLEPTLLAKGRGSPTAEVVQDFEELHNKTGLTSKFFEKAKYKATDALQASEMRMGFGSPKRSYPDKPGSKVPNGSSRNDSDKFEIAAKISKTVADITKSHNIPETIPFGNMEMSACSGCHGSLKKGGISHLTSKRFQKYGISFEDSLEGDTFAKFIHVIKSTEHGNSFRSDLLNWVLLPWRCIVLEAQTDGISAIRKRQLNPSLNPNSSILKDIDRLLAEGTSASSRKATDLQKQLNCG